MDDIIIKKIKSNRFITPLILFLAIFLFALFFVNFLKIFDKNQLIFTGGDFTLEIFLTQIAREGNLLGIARDVGWPGGFSVWATPSIGIGPYYLSLILGTLLQNISVYKIYLIVFSAGIALNSIAGYWMVEKEFSKKIYTIIMATVIGISPFALMRMGHMPVAWLYFPLFVIGIAFRLQRKQISLKNAFICIALVGTLSPLWWTFVILVISLFMTFNYLLTLKRDKQGFLNWINICFGIVASFIPTLILMYFSRTYSGQGARFPWQSDVFGGRFTDLFLSSPFLNSKLSLVEKLSDGASPEGKISHVGFVFFICIIFLIYYIFNSSLGNKINLPEGFFQLSLFTFLLYLVGGLGNLQAAFFVLFGQVSPGRAWFRVISILGILGLYLLLKLIENKNLSTITVNALFLLMIILILLDLSKVQRIKFEPESNILESGATRFLDSTTVNCPVLQIPIDTYPLMQDFNGENGSKFRYSQMIPYVLSSNNKWSLVATPGNKYWEDYKNIPVDINLDNLEGLKLRGYCAIWFDKDFSNWQINRNAGLDFTQGFWPGLRINLPNPDFENERYQIYLLK